MSSASDSAFSHLSENLEKELVKLCTLLSNKSRMRVLMVLMKNGTMNVSELCKHLQAAQPGVSHHLKLLREAGILSRKQSGRHNYYSVEPSPFLNIFEHLFDAFKKTGDANLRVDDFLISKKR